MELIKPHLRTCYSVVERLVYVLGWEREEAAGRDPSCVASLTLPKVPWLLPRWYLTYVWLSSNLAKQYVTQLKESESLKSKGLFKKSQVDTCETWQECATWTSSCLTMGISKFGLNEASAVGQIWNRIYEWWQNSRYVLARLVRYGRRSKILSE